MWTISAESFDMMKEVVTCGQSLSTSGTLVKSKLLNHLFWHNYFAPDLVKEILDFYGYDSLFEPRRTVSMDCDQRNSVSASILDVLDKETVWEFLSIPNLEEDGCEYCAITPDEVQLFPKHQIYTNGTLTCPVLLSIKTAQRHNIGKSPSSKRVQYSFKGKRCQ